VLGERLSGLWQRGRPAIMGIVNVTPDSFSDGGRFVTPEAAVEHGERLLADGADLLDVGGESTRPGADPVDEAEERRRTVPVIERLRAAHPEALISIDTSKPGVAAAALEAGAAIVNDVTAAADRGMLEVVRRHRAGLILMHMRGRPRTMQRDTEYDDVVAEVHGFLAARAAAAVSAGVPGELVMVDPGIGFGKAVEGNLALLRAVPDLASLGYPVVLGASRKSFIGKLTGAAIDDREPGSLAALTVLSGVARSIARVHDVAASRQFVTVHAALAGAA